MLVLQVPGSGRISKPDPFSRSQSSCTRRAALSSRRPPTCSSHPPRAYPRRLPRGTHPSRQLPLLPPYAGWPGLPASPSLPCSPARARAVPSARHASQPETLLPRGCPARRPGLRTTLARLDCWLLAPRRSRAGSCYRAAKREGLGKLLATPSPSTGAPAAASRQPAAASAS